MHEGSHIPSSAIILRMYTQLTKQPQNVSPDICNGIFSVDRISARDDNNALSDPPYPLMAAPIANTVLRA